MTRFGHELNYVINTFVKHTPVKYLVPDVHVGLSKVWVALYTFGRIAKRTEITNKQTN